jgi:hypothetical protein
MQGQGESQPGEGVVTLESLAEQLGAGEAAQDDNEGGDAPELSEESESDEEGSEGDSPEAEEGEEEEATVTIKHDGKDVTLKQSEALELAQKGFDYQKKTMDLAEQRKALEPIKAEVEQKRQQYDEALTQSASHLKAVVEFMQSEIGEPPPLEWASQDAGYYIAQKEQYESRKGKLERAQHALQQTLHEQARSRQAKVHEQIAETQRVLKDTLPDWNSAKEDELAAYVGELGLKPNEAEMAFWKPGFWQIAQKAKAYDALLAQKAQMKPVQQMPKVIKPGNPQPPQLAKRQEALKAHKAKPSLQTLADLL